MKKTLMRSESWKSNASIPDNILNANAHVSLMNKHAWFILPRYSLFEFAQLFKEGNKEIKLVVENFQTKVLKEIDQVKNLIYSNPSSKLSDELGIKNLIEAIVHIERVLKSSTVDFANALSWQYTVYDSDIQLLIENSEKVWYFEKPDGRFEISKKHRFFYLTSGKKKIFPSREELA